MGLYLLGLAVTAEIAANSIGLLMLQRIDGFSNYAQRGLGWVGETAEAAARGLCQIYRNNPGLSDFYDYTGASGAIINGTLNALCPADRGGLPAPPTTPPFNGGQCDGIRYRLRLEGVLDRDPSNIAVSDSYSAYGQITGITTSETASASGQVQVFCRGTQLWTTTNPPIQPFGQYATGVIAAPQGSNHRTWRLASTTRMSPGTDTCGDPPATYPITPVTPPGISFPVNIPISPTVNVAIPLVYIPIKPNISFSPQFQVDVGGINFTFDAGGVTVRLPDINPSPQPIPGYPGLPYPQPKLPTSPSTPGGNTNPGQGGTVVCPDPCPTIPEPEAKRFLKVVLTKLPDKWQYGNTGENVYFAGWIAFQSSSGGYYPRQQINFATSVFEFPADSENFTVTFTNGSAGQTSTYTLEP